MELSERKKQILKAVVEHYIESAEPVGSKLLARELGVSSATVRTEFAELCELGYLEQPHTSAGRAPTPQGYRLYVNELMERRAVSADEAEHIDETLRGRLTDAAGAVANAGQLVSSIVNYPAYSVKRGNRALTVERFELLGVDERSFITVVMTGDKNVRSQLQQTALPFDAQRLGDLKHLLNTHFAGKTRAEMAARLMSVGDQLAPELFLVVSKTVEYAAGILDEAARRDVETTGASRILTMPEYRDMDRAHELMTFLVDNKEQLPVPEGDAPVQVLIGPENVDAALRDTSVVVASYDIGDGMRGLVGVVGPTRMDYATVTARLAYFAESLSKMFGKGLPDGKQEET